MKNLVLELVFAVLIANFLMGCSNRLTPEKASRQNGYDTSPAPVETKRIEPYAVYSGNTKDGIGIYLVYWQGRPLDKQCILESDADYLQITKYSEGK